MKVWYKCYMYQHWSTHWVMKAVLLLSEAGHSTCSILSGGACRTDRGAQIARNSDWDKEFQGLGLCGCCWRPRV